MPESVEEFLARGGKITKVENGVSNDAPYMDGRNKETMDSRIPPDVSAVQVQLDLIRCTSAVEGFYGRFCRDVLRRNDMKDDATAALRT